jgi:hypothetical protein
MYFPNKKPILVEKNIIKLSMKKIIGGKQQPNIVRFNNTPNILQTDVNVLQPNINQYNENLIQTLNQTAGSPPQIQAPLQAPLQTIPLQAPLQTIPLQAPLQPQLQAPLQPQLQAPMQAQLQAIPLQAQLQAQMQAIPLQAQMQPQLQAMQYPFINNEVICDNDSSIVKILVLIKNMIIDFFTENYGFVLITLLLCILLYIRYIEVQNKKNKNPI